MSGRQQVARRALPIRRKYKGHDTRTVALPNTPVACG